MRKQDLFLNLLLVLSLVGLTLKLRHDWQQYAAENSAQRLAIHPMNGVSLPPSVAAPDYTAVSRQNPFFADRNDILEQPSALAKPIGPPPLIYGSFILGDSRFALMATEQSQKPERVPEGATFGGYHLLQVLPESVILESASGREEIMLYNALMRLPRQQAKTTASAMSHKSNPTQVASSTPSTPSTPTTASETAGGASGNSPTPVNPSAPAATVPPGKEKIDTPFGPIFVDKRKP